MEIKTTKNKIKTYPFSIIMEKMLKNPEVRRLVEERAFQRSIITSILEERIKKGMTQKELADKIGAKQSAIARLESFRSNPTLLFIKRVADALDLNLTIKTH